MVSFPNRAVFQKRPLETLSCGSCGREIGDASRSCVRCGSLALVSTSDVSGASEVLRNADGTAAKRSADVSSDAAHGFVDRFGILAISDGGVPGEGEV